MEEQVIPAEQAATADLEAAALAAAPKKRRINRAVLSENLWGWFFVCFLVIGHYGVHLFCIYTVRMAVVCRLPQATGRFGRLSESRIPAARSIGTSICSATRCPDTSGRLLQEDLQTSEQRC